jgi:hypothetical protein
MAEGLLPPPSTGVSDIMESAKGVFRATLAKCLPLALFAALFYGLSFMYLLAKGSVPDLAAYTRAGAEDPAFLWLTLLGFVGGQYFSAALVLRQNAMARGGLVTGREVLALALRRMPYIVIALMFSELVNSLAFGSMLSFLTAGFAPGLLLVFAPALYLSVCYLVIRPMIVLEESTPWSAWVRCVRLIQPLWIRALAVVLIAWMIMLVCLLAALAAMAVLGFVLGTASGGSGGPVQNAIMASMMLGLCAAGLVYLNAVWLALHAAVTAHSAASSSA